LEPETLIALKERALMEGTSYSGLAQKILSEWLFGKENRE